MENKLSAQEHLAILDKNMSEADGYVRTSSVMPCSIQFGGERYNVYIKGLSSAHFKTKGNNSDVWRAQLPSGEMFNDAKASTVPFIFLGYDAENKVYAAWNPYIVKQRLNEAKYVSFYSRLSAQVESRQNKKIIRRKLNHNGEVILVPEEKLCEYITNWNEYFEDSGKYVPIGSKRLKREEKNNTEMQNTCPGKHLQYENGKINYIAEPELIGKIEPLMNCEYPKPLPAIKIVQHFYSGKFNLDMEFKDWMNLIKDIKWNK